MTASCSKGLFLKNTLKHKPRPASPKRKLDEAFLLAVVGVITNNFYVFQFDGCFWERSL
jgi:hypothetical protein